eukprot:1534025-Amphidinium_carterae.1
MAQSLQLHAQHDSVSGSHSHDSRIATLKARPFITQVEFERATSLHKAANAAKHEGVELTRPLPSMEPGMLPQT